MGAFDILPPSSIDYYILQQSPRMRRPCSKSKLKDPPRSRQRISSDFNSLLIQSCQLQKRESSSSSKGPKQSQSCQLDPRHNSVNPEDKYKSPNKPSPITPQILKKLMDILPERENIPTILGVFKLNSKEKESQIKLRFNKHFKRADFDVIFESKDKYLFYPPKEISSDPNHFFQKEALNRQEQCKYLSTKILLLENENMKFQQCILYLLEVLQANQLRQKSYP